MAFAIAQVSPHPWEARTELGIYVEGIAGELAARGHRVLIVAPSESARRAGASRRALRDARADPSALLGRDGEPGLFFAGEVLSATGRGPGLPVDVARTVEELLGVLPHRPELEHKERTAVAPQSAMGDEWRTPGQEENGDGDYGQEWRQDDNGGESGKPFAGG